jgi:hypothetical protein
MALSLGVGFSQNAGEKSGRTLTIVPPGKYKPELSSLFVTIPLHCSKVATGLTGKSLEFSRQQLLSGYSDVDWPTLLNYCLSVFQVKKAKLTGQPTEAEFLNEIEKCKRYHTEAIRDLE